jgi:acyl carrier protein
MEQNTLLCSVHSLSAGTVQLRNELARSFGLDLPATVTFDYPTPAALAGFIVGLGATASTASQQPPVHRHLSGMPPKPSSFELEDNMALSAATRAAVLAAVAEATRAIVGTHVQPEEPLMAAGLDSLGALQLRNALVQQFGIELPATTTLDFPTISALANRVVRATGSKGTVMPQALPTVDGSRLDSGDCFSEVVGMSCIYPGRSHSTGPEGFWQSAQLSDDLPETVPCSRWRIEQVYSPDIAGEIRARRSLTTYACIWRWLNLASCAS